MTEIEWRFNRHLPGDRPALEVVVGKCSKRLWPLFHPYHYMSAAINRSAMTFALWIAGRPVAFAGIINFPHPRRADIRRVHRVVVLPDWQGLGLGMVLIGTLGAALRSRRLELRLSTASALFARTLRRSPDWRQVKRGESHGRNRGKRRGVGAMGNKTLSTYVYAGPALPGDQTDKLLMRMR